MGDYDLTPLSRDPLGASCNAKIPRPCRGSNFALRREGDSNPRYSFPYGSLANCWFKPLTHLSNLRRADLRSATKVGKKYKDQNKLNFYFTSLSRSIISLTRVPFKQNYIFNMMSMREHVNRLNTNYLVII